MTKSDSPAEKYTAAPLHKDPNRDKLYEQFKTAMAERQAALAEIGKQDARLFAIYRQTWDKMRELFRSEGIKTESQYTIDSRAWSNFLRWG